MPYESRLKSEETELLFEAILSLGSKEDCYRFFEDAFTINEIRSIAQRFHIAKLLFENRTYHEIESMTQASTATISRINKCLRYGANGYQSILEKIGS